MEWYVGPRIGRVKLADLNALHLSNLYADLLADGAMRSEGDVSASTVRGVHRALRARACS
ncbi:MAG TPA: hypothetical protein VEP49_04055 [Acidimicrobiia bacterium]|nr:hypothetical protein [Acidimicrobiia bacterium]